MSSATYCAFLYDGTEYNIPCDVHEFASPDQNVIGYIGYFDYDEPDEIEALYLTGDLSDEYIIYDDDPMETRYKCANAMVVKQTEDTYGNGLIQY